MSLKVHLPRGLDCLSDELRYLYWHGYPLKTLPMRFNPENLIDLNLPYSKVEQLWYRKKKAYELKSIDLHHSQYLVRIPDSSEIPKLERLNLLNCTKLPYISSSIQNFNYLGVLSLEGCTKFPQISGNVTTLNLIETAIEEVPSSVENLTNLKMLNLRFCERLKTVSSSICKLKSLCDLELGRCPKLESFPEILEKMERLKYIGLKCTKIRELPSSIENVEGLQRLILTDCSELNSLPQELWSLKSLKLIHGERSAISQLPSSFRDLHRMTAVYRKYQQDIGCLSSLEVLNLKGNNFVSLPSSMKQLSRLKELRLRNCSMLESLPELPPCIVEFDAANCEQLQSLPELPSRPEDELHASILEKLETLCKQSQYDVMKGMELAVLEFSNCMKLNENNILEDSQLWIQHMAVASLRRFFEEEEEEDDDDDEVMDTRKALGFSICLPGRGIPEWFSNKSSGCSIQLCCSRNFIGFALCVVLASAEVLHGGKFDGFVVECDYRFETTPFSESTCVYRTFFFETLNNDIFGDLIYESDHVCLGFDPCSHDGLSDGDHLTAISVDFSIHHKETIKVKCCGVCPIYAHPIESKPDTFTVNMVPLTEECRKLDIEAHDEASTSGTTTESGSIEGSDEEEINASQQQSSFLSQIFRCWGIDCNCL
ncbi:Disease resistance protein (TIR-NBS-LRR class) family [Melia azedarach]|uniref:Disease resistance protein (TIR-NBS-LRR class) family n=1 Tax=Melia azedarach TaxID=155640 RepID=A0ACC1YIY0_MELAZ|nr:Disease resistance protein (TIR-NBS-LRR class) family [Melia azedarach]